MRRASKYTVVFLLTLGFGLASAFSLARITCESFEPQKNVAQVQTDPAPIHQTSTDTFVPEFHNLPNFDDVDIYKKPRGRLIHFFSEGIFRKSEVVAKSRESWLVLSERKGKFSLDGSTATVDELQSISWPGEESNVQLSFTKVGQPILAIKDFPRIRTGPVTTVYRTPTDEELVTNRQLDQGTIEEGSPRSFDLHGIKYVMRVAHGVTRDGTKVAVLVLEQGDLKQVVMQTLHVPTDDRDIVGSLLWAGDMDGDGKLDLYLDEFNEKGYTHTKLHLSSLVKHGDLVGFAAHFGAAGC